MRNRDLRYVFGSSALTAPCCWPPATECRTRRRRSGCPRAQRAQGFPNARRPGWLQVRRKPIFSTFPTTRAGSTSFPTLPVSAWACLRVSTARPACVRTAKETFSSRTPVTGIILEFAHGGTQPIATLLGVRCEFPNGCSVDPTTGNLAVTNYSSNPAGPGSIAIYTGARGSHDHVHRDELQRLLVLQLRRQGQSVHRCDGLNSGTTQPLLARSPQRQHDVYERHPEQKA